MEKSSIISWFRYLLANAIACGGFLSDRFSFMLDYTLRSQLQPR
ncbi:MULTISPECIES: hypothetical protein [unclassified Anabaena]